MMLSITDTDNPILAEEQQKYSPGLQKITTIQGLLFNRWVYGTTLRIYDPKSDQWEITWIDPV